MPSAPLQEKILVIKLGALGDFVQALGPMSAIRRHHPDARITLLTTKPFTALARESGYFDEIWIDNKPRLTALNDLRAFSKQLKSARFRRVYDLQNNDRTALYLWLTGLTKRSRPEWVGAAFGASHRNASPQRIAGHAYDGHVQTLGIGGIHDVRVDTLDWVKTDTARFNLPSPYVLLIPGSAPTRPEKRWPAESYGKLAVYLKEQGYTPVVLGTEQEAPLGRIICGHCPSAVDLCTKTSMLDLVGLARGAAGAIGNDTGPMHLIAPTGCPSYILFSRHSDPVRHKPLGARVQTLSANGELMELSVEDVIQNLPAPAFRS